MSDKKDVFCYSVDEEQFHGSMHGDGCCYTREEAVKCAIEQLRDDGELADMEGKTRKVWTGKQVPALEIFKKSSYSRRIAESVLDGVVDFLYDDLGESVDHVTVDDMNAFSKDMLNCIERNISFRAFGIAEVQQHEHVVTAEDLA